MLREAQKAISVQVNRTAHSQEKQRTLQISPLPFKKVESTERIVLGVCALKKKESSKSMRQILSRIKCRQIQIVEMSRFLQSNWESWPHVDALICFHSDGFPYLMAWKYINKHKPFLINNFEKQQLLWDRSVVYNILKKIKIPIAKNFTVCRDVNDLKEMQKECMGKYISDQQNQIKIEDSSGLIELDENSNKLLKKEQVMKKFSHHQFLELKNNQQLQNLPSPRRKSAHYELDLQKTKSDKMKDRASILGLSSKILLDEYQNLIQNEIIQETKIEEIEDYIVITTNDKTFRLDKPFVQKPFNVFNHQICIYYPLSMGGGRKKLFVKSHNECSKFEPLQHSIRKVGNYIYEEFIPTNGFIIKVYTIGPYYMYAQARKSITLDGIVHRNAEGKQMRYPIILTPQEKFMCNKIVQEFQQEICGIQILRSDGKSYVCSVNGWSFAKNNVKYWNDCAHIIKRKLFQHFCPQNIHHLRLDKFQKYIQNTYLPPLDHKDGKAEQLRSIVTVFRHADRSPKQKLKIKTKDKRFIQLLTSSGQDEVKLKDANSLTKILQITNQIIAELSNQLSAVKQFMQMKIVLQSGGQFEGLNRKVQLKVSEKDQKGKVKKIVIVLKWGGELSFAGYEDSIELGKKMRLQKYDEDDCLSLYSSYKHDIKTYSSDEGRCIKTAAAFLKGFLCIDGELAPIITSMVIMDKKAQKLLDCTSQQNHSPLLQKISQQLSAMLNSEQELMTSFLKSGHKEELSEAMRNIIIEIGSPRKKIQILYKKMKELSKSLEKIQKQNWEKDSLNLRAGSHQHIDHDTKCQDISLISQRWLKLVKDFYEKQSGNFNISKLPEIFDTIRHDKRKNKIIFNIIDQKITQQIKNISQNFAHFVVPSERGVTDQQKLQNAEMICLPILDKILEDMMFWKTKNMEEEFWKYKTKGEDNWRHIRTRLYFTSASHLYSLLNLLVLGNDRFFLGKTSEEDRQKIRNILYMGYLSHVQFRLYENLTISEDDANRFRIKISISSEYHKGQKLEQFNLGGKQLTIDAIAEFINTYTFELKKNRSKSAQKSSQPKLQRSGSQDNNKK